MSETEKFRDIPWLRKGTKLERMLCFAIILSLLAVAIMTVILAYYGYHYNKLASKQQKLSNVCLTPGCVKAAASILSNLDESINPCDDFYHFACGEWLKTHSIPEDKSYLTIYDEVQTNLNLQLKTLLEAELDGTEPYFIVMTKELYDTCMDIESIEKAGAEPLKKVLKSLGGWPVVEGRKWDKRNFDWLETLISLRKLGFSHDMFITFLITVNATDSSLHTIYLDETTLGMPDRSYYISGLNDSATAAYYKKMVKAATLLGADESRAETELMEALQFEMTLANYSLPDEEKRNLSKLYNKYTFKTLQEMAPQIQWLKYANGLLLNKIDENETLSVSSPEFVKNVADLIARTDKRVVANYMLWRVVDQTLRSLSKEWRKIDFDYSAVLTGETKEKPRWEKCLANNLEVALSSYYVRHHFNAKTKEQVSVLVRYVYKEFLRILDEVDWMDDKTKKHAKAKANNILFQVGYPDELLNDTAIMVYYQNLTTSNDSYFQNYLRLHKWAVDEHYSMLRKQNIRKEWKKYADVAIINAFYSPFDNSIGLPAGYLQSPFFSKDRPNYLNFASIGATIGHEITHGFDDTGRQFDKDGNNVNWWAEITDENFRKKAQCIIDQYSNYTAENGMNLNGINTQGENIADNGGLKESYWAYQSWVKDNGPEELLPGLKYNQKQLFWIGAAYEFCSKYRPEELKDMIISYQHSPDMFRVIGPMSNLHEFSRDFNCPPDSRMNKKHKCQVW